MQRSFIDVVREIMKIAPQELMTALEDVHYWAPEACWTNLSLCVYKHITPSSKDAKAIAIYAILCNCTEAEMKARFEADNR